MEWPRPIAVTNIHGPDSQTIYQGHVIPQQWGDDVLQDLMSGGAAMWVESQEQLDSLLATWATDGVPPDYSQAEEVALVEEAVEAEMENPPARPEGEVETAEDPPVKTPPKRKVKDSPQA